MRRAIRVAVACLMIAATGLAAWRLVVVREAAEIPPALVGIVRSEPLALDEFHLDDHSGAGFDQGRLRGRWTLLFFGYTSCPDICLTSMVVLREVQAELRRRGAALPQVVFVSVDPARDDASTLASYVAHFDPDFLGVGGPDERLRPFVQQVGAMFERDAPDANGGYAVAHSASLFLVDPQVRIHASFSPPHRAGDIADALVAIRARHERRDD